MTLVHPTPESAFVFIIPKSLSKKDWMMCKACRQPQYLHKGCCLDPDCDPHVFRVDEGCVHCGFSLAEDADPNGYDVETGKAELGVHEEMHSMQQEALRQYEQTP